MSKRRDNEKVSPVTDMNKRCTDSTPGGASADTESQDASAGAMVGDTSVDTESTDTPDTETFARLDRENQGTWEAEYSYGGEADLHRHYHNCTKNPGHKNFIPVDKFSIEDLPEGYRDKDIMDYIRAVSDWTVRVTVKYVSDERPQNDCVSGKPFPGYSYRGRRRTIVGTGWVCFVSVCHENEHQTCECKDCLTSSKPQTEFGIIYICTACHVVYDKSELAHTTCHLYFDRGNTPETCEGVVALKGMSRFANGSDESDSCCMLHYTHDMELAHRLEQRFMQSCDLFHKFYKIQNNLPNKWSLKWRQPALDKQPLLFIVSHPHGCSKQISIGRCHSLLPRDDELCSFTYTTATCPGSSGAKFQLLDKYAWSDYRVYVRGNAHTHHGVCHKQPGMNLSRLNVASVFPEIVSLDLLLRDEEETQSPILADDCRISHVSSRPWPWEDICYVKEEDLRKHYDTCQNNPGHQNFFPVDKFSVDHLPPCNCKDKIMELIKVLSHLTVRVSVRYVSEERPETVPGTNIPYPWYRYRGSNQLRVGSGRVTEVEFSEDRALAKWKFAGFYTFTPTKRKFACIEIVTAEHLVYDELEGKQTTCHLFFDSGQTPVACKDVVTLTNARCTRRSIFDKDSISLQYCTHDLDLAHRLKRSLRLYKDLNSSYDHESVKQNYRKNLTPNPPLNIVVSHPHGRAKHVSISYPGCHGNTDTEEFQRPYKSITCPGSSGAPFITLNPQPLYPCFE